MNTNLKEQCIELKERNRLLSQKVEIYEFENAPNEVFQSTMLQKLHPLDEIQDYYNAKGVSITSPQTISNKFNS
jgi:hypothetical protein